MATDDNKPCQGGDNSVTSQADDFDSEPPATITDTFVQHESFLKRYLSRYISRPQDIDDLVQDTFLKSFIAEKNTAISSPKAFLFRVARNAALKELSKKSRKIMGFIEEIDESEIIYEERSMDEVAMSQQKLEFFVQSALEMPPRCRRVFLMAKVYGHSYKEIAAELNISVSAVEKHVAKGLGICSAYMKRVDKGVEVLRPSKKQSWAAGKATSSANETAHSNVVFISGSQLKGAVADD